MNPCERAQRLEPPFQDRRCVGNTKPLVDRVGFCAVGSREFAVRAVECGVGPRYCAVSAVV